MEGLASSTKQSGSGGGQIDEQAEAEDGKAMDKVLKRDVDEGEEADSGTHD